MPAIINPAYKPMLERALRLDVDMLTALAALLEDMCETKDEYGDHIIDDYTTMAHAVLEFLAAKEQSSHD